MPLFDRYLIVDWSASATPKRGKDSIWLGYSNHQGLIDLGDEANPSTRKHAMDMVREISLDAIACNEKLFIGFDFGLGYPAGAARRMTGKACWKSVWHFMASKFNEEQGDAKKRFQVANDINRDCFDGMSQFWRYPNKSKVAYENLSFNKAGRGELPVRERRYCEQDIPRAKSNWELLNPGSVGSQTLLGMAALGRLISDETLHSNISVWPFDTCFTDIKFKQITLAEIYPSAFSLAYDDEPLDHAQVKTLANGFACLDMQDTFAELLKKPLSLKEEALEDVLREEGWIVGISNQFDVLKDAISEVAR